jgi:hypothetical protein
MRLSVVIPTLDEAALLPDTLPPALAIADEVWVSDGGSRDDTVAIAEALGARTVRGPAGRGAQLNRGVERTDGEVLLFLHADTRLPGDAGELVRRAVDGGAVGGGFRLSFDTSDPLLRLSCRCANLRTRLSGCPLGDQAQFVRRDTFAAMGGFRDWQALEDLDFIRRLRRMGRTTVLASATVTSPRRYLRRGIVRNLATNTLIFALYFAGVPPHRLARLYPPENGRPWAVAPSPDGRA